MIRYTIEKKKIDSQYNHVLIIMDTIIYFSTLASQREINTLNFIYIYIYIYILPFEDKNLIPYQVTGKYCFYYTIAVFFFLIG